MSRVPHFSDWNPKKINSLESKMKSIDRNRVSFCIIDFIFKTISNSLTHYGTKRHKSDSWEATKSEQNDEHKKIGRRYLIQLISQSDLFAETCYQISDSIQRFSQFDFVRLTMGWRHCFSFKNQKIISKQWCTRKKIVRESTCTCISTSLSQKSR